jgi:hypothetical protein
VEKYVSSISHSVPGFLFAVLVVGALGISLRATPAEALICDLTTTGSSCTTNSAVFQQMDEQPTGSDRISFVRITAKKSIVEGYNTSARPLQFNEIRDILHTHDLLVSDVPVVNIGGVNYRQFGLDINQLPTSSRLSLDMLQVFGSHTGMRTSYPDLGTLVYELDTPSVDNWVTMDSWLNPGSGAGDIWFNLPDSLISSFEYVYLYSKFGVTIANNDGYEEWFVRSAASPSPVPETASLILLGSGLAGLRFWRRTARRTLTRRSP